MLIKLITTNKALKCKVEFFNDYGEFALRIAKIKPANMMRLKYEVEYTAETWDFFVNNYKRSFFTRDTSTNTIVLNVLPNGIRRTLVYKRKVDYDALFESLEARIHEELCAIGKELGFVFTRKVLQRDNQPSYFKFIYYTIRDDKTWGSVDSSAFVKFDTHKWDYEITSITSSRLKEIYNLLSSVFNAKIASTRYKRSKKHEHNAQ